MVAAKEVLIKSVSQALPTYVMSCFKILVSVYRKLTKVTNSVGGRKRTSIAYTGSNGLNYAVQKFRVLGRKGFRDMEKFKLAMLAKQG